jgi:hypothetical protein
VDPREVWSPRQLWDKFLQSLRDEGVNTSAPRAEDHWRMATYAQWLFLLEEAQEHYAACAGDEAFLKREVARQRLTAVEALIRDAKARETLAQAKSYVNWHNYRKAGEILDGFEAKHPEASDEVKKVLEKARKDFAQRRTEHFQKIARDNFVKIAENLIGAKVKEKDLLITDATSWTRRELVDESFKALAVRMEKYDAVTPEEARTYWEGRRKGTWRRVTYGAGTFIENPPKIKPPKRSTAPRPASGAGGRAAPAIQIPKPPTRDAWWADAKASEKESWLLAFFVEKSELFEVGERETRPCAVCNGVGLIHKTLQTGDVLSYLCTRCGGAQNDVVVKFR